MELSEAIRKRRSIRKFKDTPIPENIIHDILTAAMSAPSACNKRPWEFYVITNEKKLEELKGASRFARYNAPLAIVVCGNTSRALPLGFGDYWIQDCSAATENMLLAITDKGLGAVWCGAHPQKRVAGRIREILGISQKEIPLNLIWIGYPDEEKEEKSLYEEKRVHFIMGADDNEAFNEHDKQHT